MEKTHNNFYNHFFFYILTSLIIITGVASYYRFMINQDYLIKYEGVCDPSIEKCFTGCEDDECTKTYYYSEMIKYTPDLYLECGKDIIDCEFANVCLPNDHGCSITYCDPEIEGDTCASITKEQNNDKESTDEELLPENNTNNNI